MFFGILIWLAKKHDRLVAEEQTKSRQNNRRDDRSSSIETFTGMTTISHSHKKHLHISKLYLIYGKYLIYIENVMMFVIIQSEESHNFACFSSINQ